MPIDFSPLYAPTPESPTSRGLRGIGDALDAVVARRTQMEQAWLQREQAATHAHMVDDRVREQNNTADKNADESRHLREQMGAEALEQREQVRRDREGDAKGRVFDRAVKAREMRLYKDSARFYSEYQRMNRAEEARAAAEAQQGAAGAGVDAAQPPPAASPPPQKPALSMSDAPVQAELGPVEDWPTQSGEGAAVSIPPRSRAPALDVTGAVANRAAQAQPAPTTPAGPEADPLAAADPGLGAPEWEEGQMALYGDDPDYVKAIKSVAASARGRLTDPDKLSAALDRKMARIDSHRDQAGRNADRSEMHDLVGERRRQVIEQGWHDEVNKVLGNFLFRKAVGEQLQQDELGLIARQANVGPAFATLLRGKWAKAAQGAGVLTDHDLDTFYNNMGGIAKKFGRTVQDLISGTIPDDAVADIEAAIGALRQAAVAKQNQIGEKIANHLTTMGPEGVSRIPRFLGTYAPGYLPVWQGRQDAEAEANKAADALEKRLGIKAPAVRAKP